MFLWGQGDKMIILVSFFWVVYMEFAMPYTDGEHIYEHWKWIIFPQLSASRDLEFGSFSSWMKWFLKQNDALRHKDWTENKLISSNK